MTSLDLSFNALLTEQPSLADIQHQFFTSHLDYRIKTGCFLGSSIRNNRYHTCVKVCYSLGLEKELLPDSFASVIPHSTASYWRRQDAHVYLGEEFSELDKVQLDELPLFCDERVHLL